MGMAEPIQASPPQEVGEVAESLIGALGQNLTALLWHGSWARGEQTPESDHDLIVVVEQVDDQTLGTMREVFKGRGLWSTYLKTPEELRQYPMTGRAQFHFGYIAIYGAIDPPPLTRDGLIEDLKWLCASIQHESRYRVVHGAGREYNDADSQFIRKRNARWMYYQAKAAIMAMKARELVEGRSYPSNRAELKKRLSDRDELSIVNSVDRWRELRPTVEEDPVPIASLVDRFARKLVHELDSEVT